MDEARLKIIERHPIGNGLDSFRALFASSCKSLGLGSSPNTLDQLDQEALEKLTLTLFAALQLLKTVQLLRSAGRDRNLLSDISQFLPTIVSGDFDFDRVKPLLQVALDDNSPDVLIWSQVYNALTEVTPPPPPSQVRWSTVTDTPNTRSTSSILNSSELRREVDQVLREELDPRVGIRNFRKSFFASIPRLEEAAEAVLHKCCEGEEALFGQDGWAGWPVAAAEKDVLAWLCSVVPKLQNLAVDYTPATVTQRRKLLAQSRTPLPGSAGKRSMDVGFVNDNVIDQLHAGKSGRYRWSHVLVPGELKSNPTADKLSEAWVDLATYAREVLSAQDTRRFVLAFSLCGSLMRLWEYDRLGGIASEQFDINGSKGALEFVATMLGFLWMDEERLGFDPTIKTSDGKRYIEIERDSRPERLVIDAVIARPRCIAGRATTCWKAHLEDDPQTAFVIKDSWQYPEREDEGEILREVTQQGVINVARYYHHETVRIRDVDDDVRNNVRNGLDITTAVAPTVTADAMATPDSTATTVMANVTTAGDGVATATATVVPTTTTAVAEKASAESTSTTVDAASAVNTTDTPDALTADDTAATTMTMAQRSSASSASTASTAAVAAPRRRRSTAQRGKQTPRVEQLRQSESRSSKKNHGSGSSGSGGSIDSTATTGSTGGVGTKRRSGQANEADERPAKRSRSESQASVEKTQRNRIHRRIVVQDYGRPIYKASSPAVLVAALESCIEGHESLRKAGFLHRDISVNNVLIDERESVQKGFLIDLDLAIRESREKASGAKGKTGTRAFMAIGLLFGEPHCFMHDLESFFWVLFWVCVTQDGPDGSAKKNPFDHWNYARDYDLAGYKLGVITDSFVFRKRAGECFRPFYEPLIPMMDRLREVVFPGGLRWKQVDEGLYTVMRDILRGELSRLQPISDAW